MLSNNKCVPRHDYIIHIYVFIILYTSIYCIWQYCIWKIVNAYALKCMLAYSVRLCVYAVCCMLCCMCSVRLKYHMEWREYGIIHTNTNVSNMWYDDSLAGFSRIEAEKWINFRRSSNKTNNNKNHHSYTNIKMCMCEEKLTKGNVPMNNCARSLSHIHTNI